MKKRKGQLRLKRPKKRRLKLLKHLKLNPCLLTWRVTSFKWCFWSIHRGLYYTCRGNWIQIKTNSTPISDFQPNTLWEERNLNRTPRKSPLAHFLPTSFPAERTVRWKKVWESERSKRFKENTHWCRNRFTFQPSRRRAKNRPRLKRKNIIQQT